MRSLGSVPMPAAFFDLDRTVIAGSSGAVVTERLRAAGVVAAPRLPGESLLYRMYASMGENLPSMVLARQGVIALRGIERHRVLAAAHTAIDGLMAEVLPGAREAIDRHRRDGLRVVLATSTPHDLIAGFARRAGFDDVIATRFDVDDEDRYTGDLEGPFTWSAGKLAAVRAWCIEHGVALDESYAYSDSYYDVPLLESVAHPHVVNPDSRLGAVAASRQWPVITFDDIDPPTVARAAHRDVQSAGLRLLRPELLSFVRFEIDDLPGGETPILVVERASRFDPVAVAMFLAHNGRTARFVGPRDLFSLPVVGWLATMMGGVDASDAAGDDSFESAAGSLEDGEMVVIMCENGAEMAARLAAVTASPVRSLAVTGGEQVWPSGQLLPTLAAAEGPTTVSVRLGRAVTFDDSWDFNHNVSRIASAMGGPR
jgi:putative phosphoserine phosphatase/1-acylglycerol-3-phosphate O-acyltransferase